MSKLTEQQIGKYKETFEMFDTDNSGAITTSNLADVFKTLGQNIKPNQVNAIVNEIDASGTG